jgi:hypothetical protein
VAAPVVDSRGRVNKPDSVSAGLYDQSGFDYGTTEIHHKATATAPWTR